MHPVDTQRESITLVECIGEYDDYVYDISMKLSDPIFFANDIAVHNTDSVYFSVSPLLKEMGLSSVDIDSIQPMYDDISENVNNSFAEFMNREFHIPMARGEIIRCGREVVGRAGLFVAKKRYAINCYDIDGKRYPDGKLKVLGMEIKRSDTPEFVQDFLEDILTCALEGQTEAEVVAKIRKFKSEFRSLEPWKKGIPKRVNKLTEYSKKYDRQRVRSVDSHGVVENSMIPGHVSASINWNKLRQINSDRYSMPIVDGSKVIVCRLKNNPIGMTSVAYPIDQTHLPEWFMSLPFDEDLMENIVLDTKIHNVLDKMGWSLDLTRQDEVLNAFFSF